MLKKQKILQDKLASYNKATRIDNLQTLGDKLDHLVYSKFAFDDEFHEVLDALAGVSLSPHDRAGLWKRWRANNQDIRSIRFDSLSPGEIANLQMEVADMFAFFLNMVLALNMDGKDLYKAFCSKYKENMDRIDKDY